MHWPLGALAPVILIGCLAASAKKGHKSGAHKLAGRKPIEFDAQMENASVPLGKDAVFTCRINQSVKSADLQLVWLRLDSQTILAFENRLVQNNPRISVSHEERREFSLRIKDAQPEDRGHYACTVNTNPTSQMRAYLDVLVPPVILANETTEHVVVREASNVSLRCAASGHPAPLITWTREDNMYITPKGEEKALSYNGSVLNLERVGRSDMATYICMASNGVPPAVSQRITVKVEFPPMIWVEPKHVGALTGGIATLKCETEAFPQAVHFWFREGLVLTTTDKYDIRAEPAPEPHSYRMRMQLTIRNIDSKDIGDYTCSASNFHGSVEGAAKLYEMDPTLEGKITTTAAGPKGKSGGRGGGNKKKKGHKHATRMGVNATKLLDDKAAYYDKQQMDQDPSFPMEQPQKGPLQRKSFSGNTGSVHSVTFMPAAFFLSMSLLVSRRI